MAKNLSKSHSKIRKTGHNVSGNRNVRMHNDTHEVWTIKDLNILKPPQYELS
jgi:hypothetical protein